MALITQLGSGGGRRVAAAAALVFGAMLIVALMEGLDAY